MFEVIAIAAIVLAAAVGAFLAAGIDAAWKRRSVRAAKAQAARDAASGVTAARLRHPSTKGRQS